jgi:hypothetical protein
VCFGKGLAMRESVDKLLAMGIGGLQQGDSRGGIGEQGAGRGRIGGLQQEDKQQTTVLAVNWGGWLNEHTSAHSAHTPVSQCWHTPHQ